jgi:hypothetical protein
MTSRSRSTIPVAILCFLTLTIQSYPMEVRKEWGEVPPEIWAMTKFPQDTLADAVKIFDFGEMQVSALNNFTMELKRHFQIKILKKSGIQQADIEIPYWYKDDITDVRAQTILPNGDKIKLKGKNVFDEEHEKFYHRKTFAIPSAVVGCVLEVEYTLYGEGVHQLDPWVFQDKIPTVESQLTLQIAPGFLYNVMLRNNTGGKIQESRENYLDINYQGKQMVRYFYRGENLPAVKEEPFISSLSNYRAVADFQIISYSDGYNTYKFIKDLKTLCKELREWSFDEYLEPTSKVKKLVETIVQGNDLEALKIRKLYEFARDGLYKESWDNGPYPKKNQNEILEQKKATDSERNLLLMAMLTAAGFNANPVLISTRDHGRAYSDIPILRQYNRTLVAVQTGNSARLLDASDRFLAFGRLPAYDLVDFALEVQKDDSHVLSINNSDFSYKDEIKSTIQITPEGDAKGQSELGFFGYASARKNRELDRAKDMTKFFTETLYPDIKKLTMTKYDSTLHASASDTLSTRFAFEIKGAAEKVENEFYLKPFWFNAENKNVFVSEERGFPVEFNMRSQSAEYNEIELPNGYELVEKPDNRAIGNADVGYYRTIEVLSQSPLKLLCSRKFLIKTLEVPEKGYAELKGLFAKIVDADQEPIVFRMKTQPPR